MSDGRMSDERMSVDLQPIRAFLEPSHRTLLQKVERFIQEVLTPRKPPETDIEARAEARLLVKVMGEAGLFEPIAEQDYRGCCLVREALAFHSPLADAVFALQALGATPLLLGGTLLQQGFAHEAIAGSHMGAFAMTEPEAGSDAHAMSCEARLDGEFYVVNGSKTLISNGGLADFYVVFATVDRKSAKGITAFLIDAASTGVEFVRPLVMSAPHPLGEVAFRDCRVREAARIGKEGEGLKLALMTLDRLRATVGAAACGMGSRALEEAVQHAQTRRQFGKPLADLQLIQDKIARMAIRLRAARLLVYEAAWEKDKGAARVTLESGMAKAFATENAQLIIDEAVQILGGRGVLKESMVDLLYRSVRALRIYEGTTEIQHLLVAAQILKPRS
jgi:acyl-CoA dehydrogenase